MSSCQQTLDLLPCFVGDDLDLEAAKKVRAHLRECVACRREAAALQQSTKALCSLRDAVVEGVDDAAFAAMHASILVAVDSAAAIELGGMRRRWLAWRSPRWLWSAAAAVAMFAVGWQLVRDGSEPSLLDRPGLAISLAGPGFEGVLDVPAKAVPWSGGGHVQLRQLSDDSGVDPAGGGIGSGMMGRWRLRTLEDEGLLGSDLPVPAPGPVNSTGGRPATSGGR